MAKYILAIDQGTTSTRAIVFDVSGEIKGVGQKELKLYYPDNGWVEQNAEDIWADTQSVCREAVEKSGVAVSDIATIGITNQRETTVVWDKETGKPVYNAIVWQDRRTADLCADLKNKGHEDTVRQKTGLLLDPYFSATKVQWILDNVEGVRARAENGDLLFGTIDCFLLWHLTKGQEHATDITNASRTLLYNIVDQAWDESLLELFNIPANLLPEVKDNSADFGMTDILGASIPVQGMAGDQQAAFFGQACFEPGMMKSTYGTGCFALSNIGDTFRLSEHRLLTTVGFRLDGKITYAIEGAIFVAGAAVQWLRDGLGIVKKASETEQLAFSVKDNAGVYLVPAFTGLGAPYWDPHARGAITGLTRDATAAHIARATLEAQGYQTQDLMSAMAEDTGLPVAEIRVDGGMVNNDWLCQFLADITGRPVLRPEIVETTALGAAYLAGLKAGLYRSTDDIAKAWRLQKRFDPVMAEEERDRLYAGWKQAVKKVLA